MKHLEKPGGIADETCGFMALPEGRILTFLLGSGPSLRRRIKLFEADLPAKVRLAWQAARRR
jgi:hypothetical protein